MQTWATISKRLNTALELQKSGGKSQSSDVIPWAQDFKFFGTWGVVLLTLGKASATWLGTMAPLGSAHSSSGGLFIPPLNHGWFSPSSCQRPETKPLLPEPHPGKQTRNHNYSTISTRTTGAEVGREAWLDFYRPFQPMNKLLFFRSASRPIWASRCNLRLYSALFADAGSSMGGRRWRDASFFYFFFFPKRSLPGPAPIRMPEAEGCLTSG